MKSWARDLIPILQNRDIEALTLDEISELTGKSKSTIYVYFSSKEEIYTAGVELILGEMAQAVSLEVLAAEDMEQSLREMLTGIGKGIDGISIRFLEQIKLHFPETWKVIEAFTDEVLHILELIYKKGMEMGSFKKFNISLLTTLDRHFVLNIMTNNDAFCEQGLSLNALVTEYLELRLSALRKA